MSAGKQFPIYAKTLTGSNTEIRIQGTDTVLAVKQRLQDKLGTNVVRLIHKSKELSDDSKPISEYDVGEESIIIVITETEMPCHFFFALDESGSMSGARWNALLQSFVEFVDKRHDSAKANEIPIQDRVSVFFHQTRCRVASCIMANESSPVPFDNIPLLNITSSSLVNDFKSGGNNFDHVLNFLTPYLQNCKGYIPVLMFMTDGGDCGDDDPRGGDFRQRAYDRMASIKMMIPNLRVYVTTVFTSTPVDIEGAKKLCLAAGMDLSTNYNHIEDDGSASALGPFGSPWAAYPGAPAAYSVAPVPFPSSFPLPSCAPSHGAPPPVSSYASVPTTSAQRKMASHWDHVYCSNSIQAQQK